MRDSSLGECARFVYEMNKVMQATAGVEERAEGEIVSMEVGVTLPKDIVEGFIVRALAQDMMSHL